MILQRLYENAEGLKKESPEAALESLQRGYRILDEVPDPAWYIKFLKLESDINLKFGDFLKTIEVARRGLIFARVEDDKLSIALLLFNMGRAGGSMGLFDMSLEMLRQAMGNFDEMNCRSELAATHICIGRTYRKLSQFLKAVDHFYMALSIYEEQGDLAGISTSLNNMGIVNTILDNTKEAIDAFERVLANRASLEDRKGYADALNNLGLVHLHSSRHREAMECYKESLSIKREIDALSDLLPICAGCKKIRNDSGYWERIEKHIEDHSQAQMVNSLCPECSGGLKSSTYRRVDTTQLM